MQRVRIGLTGLAFVFVLVLLGMIATSHSSEEPITANSLQHGVPPGAPAVNNQGPEDPLAQLGVAPRSSEAVNGTAAQPQPAPTR